MRYTLTFARQAKRALTQELPESVAAACFDFIVERLAEDPLRLGKPLVGPLAGVLSARRGEFRILYTVDQGVLHIHVVSIRHRRDAYRA